MRTFFIALISCGLLSPVWAEQATSEAVTTSSAESATTSKSVTTEQETTIATEEVQSTEQSGYSRGSVMRSNFTSAIEEREPVDQLKSMTNDNSHVFYFTELRDMSGQTAMHRWEYDGKVMAEVNFNVNGPRWRVWSSKSFNPEWTGEWTVSVLNGAGEVISQDVIKYSQSTAAEPTSTSVEGNTVPAETFEPPYSAESNETDSSKQ